MVNRIIISMNFSIQSFPERAAILCNKFTYVLYTESVFGFKTLILYLSRSQISRSSFISSCVTLFIISDSTEVIKTVLNSINAVSGVKDAIILYESVKYILKQKDLSALYFDLYGTLNSLLAYSNVTLEDFSRWTEIIHKMPYYFKLKVGDRNCVVVHAGYTEKLEDINSRFSSLEEFYLYAREEGYQLGGKQHGMIIAGHTPTISKKSFAYNKGKVFQYYNREMDCIFYNIDCGCVFQEWELDARLACIRLEDEKVFYV